MVNLTALVKATITEPSLSLSPSRCLPGSGNFPLLFAQQCLLNLNRFPLFCGEAAKPPHLPRARAPADAGVDAGTPGERHRGCGKHPPRKGSYIFKAEGGGGPGAKGGVLGACAVPGSRGGWRGAAGGAPGGWRRWRSRGAALPSPSFTGKRAERNLGKTRWTSLLIAGTLQGPKFT